MGMEARNQMPVVRIFKIWLLTLGNRIPSPDLTNLSSFLLSRGTTLEMRYDSRMKAAVKGIFSISSHFGTSPSTPRVTVRISAAIFSCAAESRAAYERQKPTAEDVIKGPGHRNSNKRAIEDESTCVTVNY